MYQNLLSFALSCAIWPCFTSLDWVFLALRFNLMVFILCRPLKPLLKTQPYFFLSTQCFQKYLIEEFVICTLCGFGRTGVIIYCRGGCEAFSIFPTWFILGIKFLSINADIETQSGCSILISITVSITCQRIFAPFFYLFSLVTFPTLKGCMPNWWEMYWCRLLNSWDLFTTSINRSSTEIVNGRV